MVLSPLTPVGKAETPNNLREESRNRRLIPKLRLGLKRAPNTFRRSVDFYALAMSGTEESRP